MFVITEIFLVMKINYGHSNRSVEIKDGIKNRYLLYRFLIVINLLNAVLNLLNGLKNGFGIVNLLWIMLAIVFTYLFFLYFYKKSTLEIIPIDQIIDFKERSIFGMKMYYIILNDGKHRDLIGIKTQSNFQELKHRISQMQFDQINTN